MLSDHSPVRAPLTGSAFAGAGAADAALLRTARKTTAGATADCATVIVLGNGKGGSGKSTVAMHVIVGLLRQGYQVGAIDLDIDQGTLTRYLDNRRRYTTQHGLNLPQPLYRGVGESELPDRSDAAEEERKLLARAIGGLADCDVIVIDTPGADSHLACEALFYADILVTPLNDSFVDLDLLGQFDPTSHAFRSLGRYSETVWQQNKRRLANGVRPSDWIVMRNRVTPLDSRNGRHMDVALASLVRKLGVRLVGGFSERVIFRELFLDGLTLLDVREENSGVALSLSHVAARNEVRTLLREIGVGQADVDIAHATTGVAE